MSNINTDVITAVKFYVDKLLSDPGLTGMKALLVDSTTAMTLSMVYSQTQILSKEVYLVEHLGKEHEAMPHLKAAVFVQPTEENFELLMKHFREPKYQEYHLYFSNIVPKSMLTRLGRADELEVVRQVQEFYADILAVNPDFFHLGQENSLMLSSPSMCRSAQANKIFQRNVEGVTSLLLALKRTPSQIRYQQTSGIACRVASEIVARVERDDIFQFPRMEGPLVLILDRADDPVTPLLTQWTYQAMVHELLGLNNNRVSLKGTPAAKKDLEEVVLSCTQDEFFRKHCYDNFGDLGEAIKHLLDDYQKKSKMNDNINSIEDMQAFMERYPAFRSQALNVSKHVALMGELARLTEVCQLLNISQLEQEMVCGNEHSTHKRELFENLSSPSFNKADKLRLAMLFLIRYESHGEIREVKQKLANEGKVGTKDMALLDALLRYAGEERRAPNLFNQGGLMASLGKQIVTSIQGVENVYTQHQPLLSHILDSIVKGKLKEAQFPLASQNVTSAKPGDIIVFIVGGATFEEALKVNDFNAQYPQFRVILGGSCVHNSASLLREISAHF